MMTKAIKICLLIPILFWYSLIIILCIGVRIKFGSIFFDQSLKLYEAPIMYQLRLLLSNSTVAALFILPVNIFALIWVKSIKFRSVIIILYSIAIILHLIFANIIPLGIDWVYD